MILPKTQAITTLPKKTPLPIKILPITATYSISPTSQSFDANGGTGSITVTATGAFKGEWMAVSNNDWISVTAGNTGVGDGVVTYVIAINSNQASRNGTITVAGQVFKVTQAGMVYSYKISPTSQSFDAPGGSGGILVTTQPGAKWTADSNKDWLTITAGSSGVGSGNVVFTVAANSSGAPRIGVITVAGQAFQVIQSALTPYPDLTVTKLETGNGILLSFTITVKNWGKVDLNRNVPISVYLRPDENAPWRYAGGVTGGSVKALAEVPIIFDKNTGIFPFIKEGYVKWGANQIKVVLDPDNLLKEEIDKSNNQYTGKFNWQPPVANLKVVDFKLDYTDRTDWSTVLTLTLTLKNEGAAVPVEADSSLSSTLIAVTGREKSSGYQFSDSFIPKRDGLNINDYRIPPGSTKIYRYTLRVTTSANQLQGDFECAVKFDGDFHFIDFNRQDNVLVKTISISKRAITISDFNPKIGITGGNNIETHLIVKTAYNLVNKDNFKVIFNNKEVKINTVQLYNNSRDYDIWVTLPPEAVAAPFTITAFGAAGVSKDNFRVYGPPTITAIAPQVVHPGEELTIKGTNFLKEGALAASGGMQGQTAVFFPTTRQKEDWLSSYQFISENELRVKIPDNAVSGDLGVIMGFNIVRCHYLIHPTLTMVPAGGEPGTEVRIYTKGLRPVEQKAAIEFNGVKAVIDSIIDGEIPVIVTHVPPEATTGKIRITTADGIDEQSQMLFRVIAPRLDNILPDKLSPGATLTIKGQDLDLVESGILYRQILGNRFSWKLDIIERHGANELLVRLPAAESILADIAGTFTRNPQLIYKVKLNPAAYLAGPATISLWSSQTTARQTNEVHFTLLEPDGTAPRPETRVAAITSGSVNQVSFGDQITLYGENLDVICQIYIKFSLTDQAIYECQVIGIPQKNQITIQLPTEAEIRSHDAFLPAGKLSGELTVVALYVVDISKILLDSNCRWMEPFKMVIQ
jgi:hypothetical protein